MSIVSLLFLPVLSIGSPVTVLSYNYDIGLNFSFCPLSPSAGSYCVNFAESHTHTGIGAGPEVSHLIGIDDYQGLGWTAFVGGNVSPFQIYGSASHMEMDSGLTVIEASWLFTPNYDKIQVDFVGYLQGVHRAAFSESWATYNLIDISDSISLTTGSFSVVFDSVAPGPWPPDPPIEYVEIDDRFVFDFSLDRTYKLTLTGKTQTGDFAIANVGASFSTVPVPEPATTLLLTSGLLGLAGLRRKFRK
jgi:hypothetical protein